jgi:hypothetical protein
MWISGFCLRGGTTKKNAHVLKDISSFLLDSNEPSNNTQQWGLKPPEEELVNVEIISHNEG